MKTRISVWPLIVTLAVVLTTSSLLAQTADAFIGTWQLNPKKSRYPAGTCPKQMTIVMELSGDGVHYRSETIHENGAVARAEYTAAYDSTPATVTGTNGLLLPVSLKRLDARTVVASYLKGFKIVAASRREVSVDGQIMTITTTSQDKSGKDVTNVGVYERVPTLKR